MSESQRIMQDIEKTKKLEMGPRWTPEELDLFLKHFREKEMDDLDSMQAELLSKGYQRSKINLVSVFSKNKNFLRTNKNTKGEVLASIMADHYDNLEIMQQEEQSRRYNQNQSQQSQSQQQSQHSQSQQQQNSTKLTAKDWVKQVFQQQDNNKKDNNSNNNNGNNINSSSSLQQQQQLSASAALRKNNSKKKILQQQQQQLLLQQQQQQLQMIQEDKKKQQMEGEMNSITAQIRKRKTINQDGKYIFNSPNDLEYRIKLIEEESKNCRGLSAQKRQISPERISQKSIQFVENEFFYSTIDKPFFQFNEFKEMLAKVSLKNVGTLSREEWRILRLAMGKIRRFSPNFLRSKQLKLQIYRDIVRKYQQTKNDSDTIEKLKSDIRQEVMKLPSMSVGHTVLSLHPNCGHFHTGSILTCSGNVVIVKFLTTDSSVLRIPDTRLVVLERQERIGQINKNSSEEKNGITLVSVNTQSIRESNNEKQGISQMVQDLDYASMAMLIKLLDRKVLLIKQLRDFNDQAEHTLANGGQLEEAFYQEYGWTGIQINLLDSAMKSIVPKFRLRGLNNFNQQEIGENLHRILNVPLSYIERELEENQIDPITLQQIKQIQSSNNEEKIQQSVNQMISKGEQKLIKERGEGYKKQVEATYYKSGYGNLINIVSNCVGILQTLKNQGEINITQNTFLEGLASSVYGENKEQFLEINDAIQDILEKHRLNKHSMLSSQQQQQQQQNEQQSSAFIQQGNNFNHGFSSNNGIENNEVDAASSQQ